MTNEETGLEQSLFEGKNWNEKGINIIRFYNVTLKKDIGKFKIGDKFDLAFIDFELSSLDLMKDGQSYLFELKLEVKT